MKDSSIYIYPHIYKEKKVFRYYIIKVLVRTITFSSFRVFSTAQLLLSFVEKINFLDGSRRLPRNKLESKGGTSKMNWFNSEYDYIEI